MKKKREDKLSAFFVVIANDIQGSEWRERGHAGKVGKEKVKTNLNYLTRLRREKDPDQTFQEESDKNLPTKIRGSTTFPSNRAQERKVGLVRR